MMISDSIIKPTQMKKRQFMNGILEENILRSIYLSMGKIIRGKCVKNERNYCTPIRFDPFLLDMNKTELISPRS